MKFKFKGKRIEKNQLEKSIALKLLQIDEE